MKNEHLYNEYAIQGWPSQFYTIEIQEKYNDKIKKYCQALPDGTTHFTKWQDFCLTIYSKFLFLCDIIKTSKQSEGENTEV